MSIIAGADEVGRGCWAGPLVVCVAILDEAKLAEIEDRWLLKDSKKLSKKQREQADKLIREITLDFSFGWVSHNEIDLLGLSDATILAFTRAADNIKTYYNELIIDGNINFLKGNPKARCLIKADDLIASVSAASILAKVARDNYMEQQELEYPGYGFGQHVGYGTKLHIDCLEKLGPSKIHRLSYKPVAKFI